MPDIQSEMENSEKDSMCDTNLDFDEDENERNWKKSIRALRNKLDISRGDIYEDSFLHPCLCIEIDYNDDEIWGISLIDGSYPRSCSLLSSGIRKLSVSEAWKIKMEFSREKK